MKHPIKFLAMVMLITFQACMNSDNLPDEEEEIDLDNPSPIPNNGSFQAIIDGSNYESDLNVAVMAENSAMPDLGNIVVFSAQISGPDTLSVTLHMTRDIHQLQPNQWYHHTVTQFVTGIFRDTESNKFGMGPCSIQFTQLDNAKKMISGTFQFTADVFQLPSPVIYKVAVEGNFSNIQFVNHLFNQ